MSGLCPCFVQGWALKVRAHGVPDMTTGQDTAMRAEYLRKAIEALALDHEGVKLGQITISVGVAAFPDDGRCSTPSATAAIAWWRVI